MTSRSSVEDDDGREERVGRGVPVTTARDHDHMPRRRNRARPFLASSGSRSPNAAARNVSYCLVTDAPAPACAAPVLALAAAFFFPQERAQSFVGGARSKTYAGLALPARVLGSVHQG